jgi:hypothetical protein
LGFSIEVINTLPLGVFVMFVDKNKKYKKLFPTKILIFVGIFLDFYLL